MPVNTSMPYNCTPIAGITMVAMATTAVATASCGSHGKREKPTGLIIQPTMKASVRQRKK